MFKREKPRKRNNNKQNHSYITLDGDLDCFVEKKILLFDRN